MKKNMPSTTIQVQIKTAHWLKHKVIYIPREFHSFFPGDALGARGEPERATYPERGVPVTFDYGVTKSICDISTDKAGKMRPRDTGKPIDDFFKAFGAAVGDFITISRGEDRVFNIKLVKVNGSTV
jgi:hypothetical protein